MSTQPDRLITERQADSQIASLIGSSLSRTRAALDSVIPRSTGGTVTQVPSVAQAVVQLADGSWPNPVRDPSLVGARLYVALHDAAKTPGQSVGLRTGDVLYTSTGIHLAAVVPSLGAVTWRTITTTTAGPPSGGDSTTPGGSTTPPPAAAEPTSRPSTLMGTTGTWTTTGGATLVQALSDRHLTSASATPATVTGGVSVSLEMTPLAHTTGNDIVLTVWGATTNETGTVTATLRGANGAVYGTALTQPLTSGVEAAVEFKWADKDLLSLPADAWRGVTCTITRPAGGFTKIADVTLQSVPVAAPTTPGIDPLTPTAILWHPTSIWYSDLTSAPLASNGAAVAAYVRSQSKTGTIRLDAYADAAPIRVVPASTPRVNITPPASSTRGAVTLMHTTAGTGALDGVPIPTGMEAPTNLFKTAVIACVETGQVWELIGLTKDTAGVWSAQWGGRIDGVPDSGGAFPTGTGYTGSGLAWTAAAVKIAEARDALTGNVKAIPHALGLNLPYGMASTQYAWPATRSDGTSYDTAAPKMGQRVRLAANADLSGCTPLGRAVGEALKRYGAVVMGGAAALSIVAESGATEQGKTGVDPWGGVLDGKTVDTALAGIPLDRLEGVSPGWGGPGWVQDTAPVVTTPPTTTTPPPVVTTPPPTGDSATWGYRTRVYAPTTGWLSGASCRAIENSSEGMGSPWAQWRGEPAYMARTWWDQDSKPDWTLGMRWNNWHASIDGAPGLMFNGEDWAKAAAGDSTMFKRLETDLRYCRQWYLSRRDPSKVNFFLSPAHEANGDWYRWSWRPENRAQWIEFMKRYRELQLRVFPEALMTLNVNYDTKASVGMDWRRYIPDYDAKGAAGVKTWFDVGSVDYYNAWSVWANTVDGWNQIAYNKVDQWGAPIGIDKHRQFWERCGLPMTVPEWGGHATRYGDAPQATVAINDYFRRWAGGGPGRVIAEAYFNLTSGYDSGDSPGKFALYGDTVALTQTAAKYRELTWGV